MPKCPRCGNEYAPDVVNCTNCEIPLEKLSGEESLSTEEFVTLITVGDENEARVIQGLLVDAGIPVWVHPHGTTEAFPLTIGEQGETEVMVSPEHLEAAQKLLNDAATVSDEELATDSMASYSDLPQETKEEI